MLTSNVFPVRLYHERMFHFIAINVTHHTHVVARAFEGKFNSPKEFFSYIKCFILCLRIWIGGPFHCSSKLWKNPIFGYQCLERISPTMILMLFVKIEEQRKETVEAKLRIRMRVMIRWQIQNNDTYSFYPCQTFVKIPFFRFVAAVVQLAFCCSWFVWHETKCSFLFILLLIHWFLYVRFFDLIDIKVFLKTRY